MTLVGLSSGVTVAWWLSLGAGLVIAAVVTALLEILRRTVHEIRRGVDDVLSMGGRLAQNTWAIQLLETTKARGADLVDALQGQNEPDERSEQS